MTWQERLREAAYTSPSGTRLAFQYEDVREVIARKTTAYEFPDARGTYVQDLGTTGRRYPVRAFFWGDNCDLAAAAFMELLAESGVGTLEHPMYGKVSVVTVEQIIRRDPLKTAANQAIVEVTFWETTGLIYPSAEDDLGSAVLTAVEEYNGAASEAFAATPGIDSAVGQATLKSRFERNLIAVDSALRPIAETQDDVAGQFDAIYDSISLGIDVLVAQPLTLAFQTVLLIQSPARAVSAIADRLNAYADLLSALIAGEGAAVTEEQDFRVLDLFASTYIAGMVVAVVNNTFLTKGGAIQAAEIILDQFETLTGWRDSSFDGIDEVDTGEAYQQLQEAVAIAAGFLVQLSFSLLQERTLILQSPRSVVDLVAELYGEVDTKLDFFISSNELTGSDIMELQKGRRIVFYV